MSDTEVNVSPKKERKPKKTFKEYSQDPEFKARHKAYIKTPIACPVCDRLTPRYNMSNHKKTKKCINIGVAKQKEKELSFSRAIEIAKEQLEKEITKTD